MHFFLHGGMARIDSDKNQRFFQNICKDGDKILICLFASEDRSTWEERFMSYQGRFAKYNPNKNLSFELASDDIPTLVQQIKNNSVIYFGGGFEDKILAVVNKVPQFRELLEDKIIVGSSAGSNMWANCFYTQDFEEVRDGLGWLSIKTICHWGPGAYANGKSDEEREKILDNYGEKLPIYKIPEQEYIEFEI